MTYTINFNQAVQDAKSVSFEALPVGEYDVEVVESTATTSSSGKPMIKVKMKVITGPYAPRTVFNQFVFSSDNPTALSIFFRHMRAFGLDEGFFASLGAQNSLDPVAAALMGRRATVKLSHREWQGEMRNNVEGFRPFAGTPGAGTAAVPGMPGMPPVPGVPGMPPAAPPAPAPAPAPAAYPPAQPQGYPQAPPAPPIPAAPPAPPAQPPTAPAYVDPALAEMTNAAPPQPVYQPPAYAPQAAPAPSQADYAAAQQAYAPPPAAQAPPAPAPQAAPQQPAAVPAPPVPAPTLPI